MSKEILIKVKRDPLFGHTEKEYREKIRRYLEGKVREAYLFGSLTAGTFNDSSDVDIIIICDTDLPFVERASEFHELLDMVPTTDILVYTPDEFEKMMKDEGPGFWKDVRKSMERIV